MPELRERDMPMFKILVVVYEFIVSVISVFGKSFQSKKKFVELFDKLVLYYYEAVVQNLSNWNAPAPKLNLSD